MNCIEKGTKQKLRFPIKGLCSIEDLWDIELTLLDEFAISLDNELGQKSKSFIDKKKVKDPAKKLMFDIVKRIIEVRMELNAKVVQSRDTRLLREKAARILADRKDSAMEELSDKELEKIAKG